jgi:hypothetical protein
MMSYGTSRWRDWVLDEEEPYRPHPVLGHS